MGGGRRRAAHQVCADQADLCGSGCGQGEAYSQGVSFQALQRPPRVSGTCEAMAHACKNPTKLTSELTSSQTWRVIFRAFSSLNVSPSAH